MKLRHNFNIVLHFCLYCSLHVCFVRGTEVCTKVTNCACESSAGLIDLLPLAHSDNTPRFKDEMGQDAYYYSWNPCYPFTEGSDGCKDTAGCQTDGQSVFFSLGTQNSSKFINDVTAGLQIQYESSPTGGRTLIVTLVCNNKSESTTITATGETPPSSQQYYMTLTSPHCCPGGGSSTGGLSIGSILVILFAAVIFVYALGGVGFKMFVRKASGKERMPNYEFWSSIPGLILAGVMFTLCCGKRSEYNSL